MNSVGLNTVGRLLGHRKRRTTAIYAQLDDAARQDAAVIAVAMGYRAGPLLLPAEAKDEDAPAASREFMRSRAPAPRTPLWLRSGNKKSGKTQPKNGREDRPRNPIV